MNCDLVSSFTDLCYLVDESKKKQKDYAGFPLYSSEISLIEAVYFKPESNVSQLADYLKVTKGAVTQTAGKLLEKKLIETYLLDSNKKEKYFRLTEDGLKVKVDHQYKHDESNKKLCEYMKSLSPAQAAVIHEFMEVLKDCVPICMFTCDCRLESEKGGCKSE